MRFRTGSGEKIPRKEEACDVLLLLMMMIMIIILKKIASERRDKCPYRTGTSYSNGTDGYKMHITTIRTEVNVAPE